MVRTKGTKSGPTTSGCLSLDQTDQWFGLVCLLFGWFGIFDQLEKFIFGGQIL